MENASKALIIAGAILLSILIIGLGMSVYNSASSSVGSANMDAQEIQSHNSQFLSYQGKQKGSQVIALINQIKKNNKDYADRIIFVNMSEKTQAIEEPASASVDATPQDTETLNKFKPKASTTYYVTFGYNENGIISGVEIHVFSDKCGTSSETIKFNDVPTGPADVSK